MRGFRLLFVVLALILFSPFANAAEKDFFSAQNGLEVQSFQAVQETVKETTLPIYVQIDRDTNKITIINRNDVPVDLSILAMDADGLAIASWPLPAFSHPTGVSFNFSDIFRGVLADQIASIKVVSDDLIRIVEINESINENLHITQAIVATDNSILTTSSLTTASILAPVLGSLRVTSSNLGVSDGKWEFNQHKSGYHHPGGGISGSDDTYAWDANLYTPTNGNADVGQDVYAVADGDIVSYAGVLPTTKCGSILIAHPNKEAPEWWSGYLHLQVPVNVIQNQPVTTSSILGKIGRSCNATNDHLHFVVYRGQNVNGGLISFNTTIIERSATTCSDFGEPNDSFSTAYSVSCGDTNSAKICSLSDVDYYKVTPSSSGMLTVRLTPPSDKDYDLHIYNSSQAVISKSEYGTGVQDVCDVSVTAGQTYYIKVNGYDGRAFSPTSNYRLEVTCPSGTPTPGTVLVYPTSGSWTSSPQNVSVSSSNASSIYYTIRWTTDGATPAEPPEPTSSVNDGSISGSSGIFQVYANAGQNKKLKVRFRGTNSGGYGTSTGSYLYTINLSGSTTCSDFGEPNDSFSSAFALSCGTPYAAKICSATDVDHYKVTPSSSGTLTVRLAPPSGKDYDLFIYNSSQTQISKSTNGTGVQDVCDVSVTAGQMYYIKVKGYNSGFSTTSNYSLGVTCSSGTTPTLLIDGGTSSTKSQGSTFNFTGSNYTVNGTVYRYLVKPDGSQQQLANVTANSSGNVSWSYPSICADATGTYRIWARDASNGKDSNSVNEVITSSPSCSSPTLLIDGGTSSTKSQGGTYTCTGSNYTPNGSVTRSLRQPNGSTITLTPTIYANSSGNISWPYTSICTTSIGTYNIWVKDDATGKTSNTVNEVVTHSSSCP